MCVVIVKKMKERFFFLANIHIHKKAVTSLIMNCYLGNWCYPVVLLSVPAVQVKGSYFDIWQRCGRTKMPCHSLTKGISMRNVRCSVMDGLCLWVLSPHDAFNHRPLFISITHRSLSVGVVQDLHASLSCEEWPPPMLTTSHGNWRCSGRTSYLCNAESVAKLRLVSLLIR